MALVEDEAPLYLYLTCHLAYPIGTRIITLSRRSPTAFFYKEISPMLVHNS